MPRFAIYDANATVVRVVTCADKATAQMNAPAGCVLETCNESVMPGWKRAGGKFIEPAAAPLTLEQMLEVIDAERESLMKMYLTSGEAKSYEYAEKAKEFKEYNSLSVTLQLTSQDKFPWAAAEAAATGMTLAQVMANYGTAMTSTAKVRLIAAKAQALKRALRAGTATTRPTIFAARVWPA